VRATPPERRGGEVSQDDCTVFSKRPRDVSTPKEVTLRAGSPLAVVAHPLAHLQLGDDALELPLRLALREVGHVVVLGGDRHQPAREQGGVCLEKEKRKRVGRKYARASFDQCWHGRRKDFFQRGAIVDFPG